MALVLKKFHLSASETDEPIVEIQGRQSGLIGFFLSILKLDDTTSLTCYKDRIEYKSSSLWGEQSLTIPAAAVTGICGGFKKPLGWLIAAAFLFFMGIISSVSIKEGGGIILVLALVISLVFIIIYFIKKEMNIGVQNGGDKTYGMTFNRSIIENIDVDSDKVTKAIQTINSVVLRSKQGKF
jgi:hypothetical protein